MNLENLSKIAIIPLWIGFAYLLAFAYEGGFITKWKIPIEYLKFNLSVLSVAAATLIFVSLIFVLCALAVTNGENMFFRLCLAVLILIIICVGLVLLYSTDWKNKIWLPVAVFLFSAGIVGLLLVLSKDQVNSPETKTHIPILLLGITALFFSIFTAYAIGRTRATKQTTFLVTTDETDLVVLRIYGDKIICAKQHSQDSKTIKNEFVIINSSQKEQVELKLKEIGPLTLE